MFTDEQLTTLRQAPIGEHPNRLRLALALAGIRQTELAADLGLRPVYVSEIVNGRAPNISLPRAQQLAAYFGCSVDDLFPSREQVAQAS